MKGEEPYFRITIAKALKKHYRSVGYEVEDLDGTELTEDQILDSLDQASPGALGKLVVVRNAEKIKDKKGKLSRYLDSPSESVVVVFDASGECGSKFGAALVEKAVVFESNPLKTFNTDVEKWVQDEAASYGKTMSPAHASTLRHNIGTDLFSLKYAVKKIALHSDGQIIHDNDLRAVITKTSGSQVYEMTNAFGDRNLKKAFAVLDAFYGVEDDPALLLCSALLNCVERLIRAKSLMGHGLDKKDVATVLGMNSYVFEKSLEPQLKNWTVNLLIDAQTALCAADISLKGSGLDKRVLIENFLSRFLDREFHK